MAANEQKGFIVYLDSYDMISMLSQEQKGALLDAMFSVYGCCERPEMDQATAITFVTIERYLKDNREKWLKTQEQWAEGKSERSEQASRAANARWQKHREQCSPMQNDADACSSDADLCSSNADACSSMLEQCSAMLSDAIVTSNQLSVNSKDNNISLVENKPQQTKKAAASTPCSADAEPRTRDASAPGDVNNGKPAQPRKREVDEHFEELWAMYPSKRGKNQVKDKTKRQLMGVRTEDMRKAIDRYVAEVEAAPYDRQWLNGSTWFNGRFLDYLGDDYTPPPAVGGSSSRRYVSAEGPRDFSDREE